MDVPDLYRLDALLSDEERMIRDTVREFIDEKLLPVINRHFREETFPHDLVPEVARMGLLGANLEGYGCAGMGARAYGLILEELERGDSGFRSFASVQGALCMYPIHRYGSEGQKERWLPKMASGETIGCFGLTEPGYGSDPSGMETRAARKGDRWILNGAKMWITNAGMADLAIVWAKTEGDDPASVRGFVLEKGMKGLAMPVMEGKWSLRASVTGEIVMHDVEVPDENRLPEGKGLGAPLSCLNQARYGIAWGAVGAAKACLACAIQYSKERKQFGKPIGSFQLIQEQLAEMYTDLLAGELLCFRLADLKEAGEAKPETVSLAKRHNVAMALRTARTCRSILGAAGILDEYPVMRHMMNLESVYTYEGTHEIHTLIVGKALTGLAAFGG